jgi:hypothetical protein
MNRKGEDPRGLRARRTRSTRPRIAASTLVTQPRKKSADAAKGAAIPGRLACALLQVYRPSVLLPLAVGLAAVITWPWLPRWLPNVSHRAEYVVMAEQVQLLTSNPWAPRDLAARVLGTIERKERLSLLDPQLAEKVGRAFAACPWVKEVRQVRTHRDGTIAVDATLRDPVLMLRTSQGMYPLDGDGVLLPPEDFRAEDAGKLPVAWNARSLPGGPAGTAWGDPVVIGATRLAQRLASGPENQDHWKEFGLEAILLPRPESASPALHELTYELVTKGGSRIVWGNPPGCDSLEPPAEIKIERLRYFLRRNGSFEMSGDPCRIDIRPAEIIVAEPLPQALR